MERFIFVPFNLHDVSSGWYVYKSNPWVIGGDHNYVLIIHEELDSSDFTSNWKLTIIVFDIDLSIELQLLKFIRGTNTTLEWILHSTHVLRLKIRIRNYLIAIIFDYVIVYYNNSIY